MPQMNMIEAIRDALDVKMSQDPDVLVFGEDVGYFGGVFRATAGLQDTHGLHRCFDTPIIFIRLMIKLPRKRRGFAIGPMEISQRRLQSARLWVAAFMAAPPIVNPRKLYSPILRV